MAYLGNDLQVAFPVYRNIDDISGSFNSSTTSFPLRVSGVAPVPAPLYSQQCLISVGGVVQRPDDSGSEGFRLSGGNIIFASAPTTGADFFGVILAGADYINAGGNFPSGTAAVPSITFNDDLDTGIYNSGINQVSITTGGSERLRIDSAGQIESVSLGTAAAPAFSFTTDPNTGIYSPGADQVAISTGGSGRLFVDANGNVGVGTTSPTSLLHLSASALADLRFTDTGEATDQKNWVWQTGTGIGAGTFRLRVVNDANSTGENAYIVTRSGASAQTHQWLTAGSERLRITSAGLVGVGTSSPGFPFQVKSTTNAHVAIWDNGGIPQVLGVNDAGGSAQLRLAGQILSFTGSGGAGSEHMRLDASGRLGIGTTSPGYALHVVGTINSSDANIGFRTALTNGLFQAREFGGSPANNTLEFNIRPDSGKSGYLTFTETSVADRWSIGIQNGSNGLRFISGTPTTGTERCRIDGSGRLLVGTSSTSATLTALLQGNSSSATSSAGLLLARGEEPAVDGTVLGALDYSANNHVLAARILCKRDGGTWTAGTSQPTRLEFSTTADGASSPTERMRINKDGNVFINASSLGTNAYYFAYSPGNGFGDYGHVDGTASGVAYIRFLFNGGLIGSITQSGTTAVAYNTSSDYRLKENVTAVADGITRLQQLKPSRFNFIADPAKTIDGFLAHEVQAIVPEAITGEKDAVDDDGNPIYQGIDQSKLVPLLTAALQEAIGEIESLKARVAALETP